MLYLERVPHPTLTPFIHNYWYSCDPAAIHRQERVLPTGRPTLVISLARDFLINANHPTDPLLPQPAALFLGIYSHHQLIDTIDLTELIGITFHPGGTVPFFPDTTHIFTNRETSLEDLWGRAALNLRNDLRESPTPTAEIQPPRLRPPPSPHRIPHPAPHPDHRLRPRKNPTLSRHHHRHRTHPRHGHQPPPPLPSLPRARRRLP